MSNRRAVPLNPGDPAPWFVARSTSNERYHFDTVAGRYVVLCFFGSAGRPEGRRLLDDFLQRRDLFDDDRACFFGVSSDPEDESTGRVREQLPGYRYFWDAERVLAGRFGVAAADGSDRLGVYVLDPRLRVLACFTPETEGGPLAARALEYLEALPPVAAQQADARAPVLIVPRVFEPTLCRALIEHYATQGGKDSGFMRDVDGKTVGIYDYAHKRRTDCLIEDDALRQACMVRVHDRLAPEIEKAFQFRATRMERYIVACYDAATSDHFRPHRDNTTRGTAHRRFAVTLNLNPDEYEGGDLRFPEFGPQTWRAPLGGAVVFSCSLMHEALPVTRGRRFAFLPFLYDDAAAQLRAENQKYLAREGSGSP